MLSWPDFFMKFPKKIRFFFRLTVAFWQAHKKTIILTSVLGIFITVVGFKFFPIFFHPKSKGIGVVGKYTPETLPNEILLQITQGLTFLDKSGSANSALADFWQIEDDGKTYEFTLKDNFFWHDKTRVSAKDLSYNFDDVLVQKIDEKTIRFQLKETFSPFPVVVSRPLFKKGLLGTGKYKVTSIKRNGQIVERLDLVSVNSPSEKLIYKFYPTEAMAKTAFKLGKIDIINEVADVSELSAWPNLKITSQVKTNQIGMIIFNTQNEFLSEKTARQALAYGLKKDWENRAYGPLSPESWAYSSNLKKYEFDFSKAQELLGQIFEEGIPEGTELRLSTFPTFFSLAEEIANDWKNLGFKVDIETVDIVPTDFQIFLVVEDVPPDPDQYFLWHSTQAGNLSRFKSPQIDKLLEEGRKTLDREKRKEAYFDFQRFLVEDAPAIFLFHPTVHQVTRD